MQQALAMRGQFRRVTCLAVVGIDQDHLFRVVVHFPSPIANACIDWNQSRAASPAAICVLRGKGRFRQGDGW
jgi:hypothetical protein